MNQECNYTEIGRCFFTYPMPASFDDWGWNDKGEKWEYSFCVMDDFGNAVPGDPFAWQFDECSRWFAPDFTASVAPGEFYPYKLYPAGICH